MLMVLYFTWNCYYFRSHLIYLSSILALELYIRHNKDVIWYILSLTTLAFFEESYKLCMLSRYALYHLLFRIPWTCMLLWALFMLDMILKCLDVCLICLDETHVVCYISILNLMFYDSAWELIQVRTLTLFYCDLILFDMLFFEITLVYLGTLNQSINYHISLNLVNKDLRRV